jgi:hypothetical protein
MQARKLVMAGMLMASAFALSGCAGNMAEAEGGPVQMARDASVTTGTLARTERQTQASTTRVYLIRGLADVFSRGMDELGGKLRQRGFNATEHNHSEWAQIAASIAQRHRATGGRERAIIIGHSLGADAVVYISNQLASTNTPVALAVAYDPVSRLQVSGGARRFVNLFQSNNGWAVPLSAGPGFRGRFQNVDLHGQQHLNHFNIEKDAGLHNKVMGWVQEASGGARRAAR